MVHKLLLSGMDYFSYEYTLTYIYTVAGFENLPEKATTFVVQLVPYLFTDAGIVRRQ